MAEKKTIKPVFIYALALLIIILSAVLLYLQYTKLSDLRAEKEQEELALDAARLELTRLIDYRDNAAEYEQRFLIARRKIPPEPAEEEILRHIYRLAAENDLQVADIRYGSRSSGENYTAMPLTIILDGSYQDLRQMLRHLQNSDRAFRVNEIRINRSGGDGSGSRVTLNVNAFYNPEN